MGGIQAPRFQDIFCTSLLQKQDQEETETQPNQENNIKNKSANILDEFGICPEMNFYSHSI